MEKETVAGKLLDMAGYFPNNLKCRLVEQYTIDNDLNSLFHSLTVAIISQNSTLKLQDKKIKQLLSEIDELHQMEFEWSEEIFQS